VRPIYFLHTLFYYVFFLPSLPLLRRCSGCRAAHALVVVARLLLLLLLAGVVLGIDKTGSDRHLHLLS
jgi:hypothetical protein